MRWIAIVFVVACGAKKTEPPAPVPMTSGSAVDAAPIADAPLADAPQPPVAKKKLAKPPKVNLPPPPTSSPSPKLALVKCFAAPIEPFMRAGDPDVPGTAYGYHAGAPPTTPYQRQPFGLAQPPLAKPAITSYLNADRFGASKKLDEMIVAHEAELVACFAKALADPSESQHEVVVIWPDREVKPPDDDKGIDASTIACVKKVIDKLPIPPSMGKQLGVGGIQALRLKEVPRPPLPPAKDPFATPDLPNGTRAYEYGWSAYRLFDGKDSDDGAALAPKAEATMRALLPKISKCLAAKKPLTGSLRGVLTIGEFSPELAIDGLGNDDAQYCFVEPVREAKLTNPAKKDARLLCDFTWGDPKPLRATVEKFEHVVRVHATGIEYREQLYTPDDDLPRSLGTGGTIVIANPDAPGSSINAAIAFAGDINDVVMLAVQTDSGPPFYVGRAAMPTFTISPGAHVGFSRAGGKIDRCDKPCDANKPCEGAWIGIGDDNVATDLLAIRAETERAGFPQAVVGRRACGP